MTHLWRNYSFALVDPSQREHLPAGICSLSLAGDVLAGSVDLLPSLVCLGELSAKQRLALLEQSDARHVAGEPEIFCALLDAPCSSARMQSHLAQAQVLRGPDGEHAWLRIHDPRVWLQLPRIVRPSELCYLFGPVQTWCVPIQDGWIATRSPPSSAERLRAGYRTDAQQWSGLMRIGIVNRALMRLNLLEHEDIVEHGVALDALAARGQARHRLDRVQELVEYVCLGWQMGDQFDEHPIALGVIAAHESANRESGREGANDVSPLDALTALDAEQQQIIRGELARKRTGQSNGI